MLFFYIFIPATLFLILWIGWSLYSEYKDKHKEWVNNKKYWPEYTEEIYAERFKEPKPEILAMIGLSIGGAILNLFLSLILFFLLHIPFSFFSDTKLVETQRTELASMGRNTETGGSFFLGIGSINSEPVYYYYYHTGNNSYQLGRQRAVSTNVTVREDPNLSGRGYYIRYDCKQFNVIINYWLVGDDTFCSGISKHTFVVPEGTINRNFSL